VDELERPVDDDESLDENEKYLEGLIACLANVFENGTAAKKSYIVKELKRTGLGDIIMFCSHGC